MPKPALPPGEAYAQRLAFTTAQEVATKHNLEVGDIIAPTRELKHIAARFELVYLLHNMNMNFCQIGRFLNRDHRTIMNAYRRYEATLTKATPSNE